MTYSEKQQDAEKTKLIHDFLKHIATLSTGSLLLIVAFIEKLFDNPEWNFLVGISITSFLVSIISSIVALAAVINLMHQDEIEDFTRNLGILGFVGTWLGFTIGIVSLGTFALKNLF